MGNDQKERKSRQTISFLRLLVFLGLWMILGTVSAAAFSLLPARDMEHTILNYFVMIGAILVSGMGALYAAFTLIKGDDFEQAQAHLGRKEYCEASRAFERHAQKNPNEAASAYYLAARAAIRSNVVDESVPMAPGASLVFQGDIDGAIRYYRLAIECDQHHDRAFRELAELLPEDAPERFELLQRSVDIQPNYTALLALADHYGRQG